MKAVKFGDTTIIIREKDDIDPYIPYGEQKVVDIIQGGRVIRVQGIRKEEVESLKEALDSAVITIREEDSELYDIIDSFKDRIGNEERFREIVKRVLKRMGMELKEKEEESGRGEIEGISQ